MNILAVETSSSKLCIGLMNNKGRVVEYALDAGRRHSELLLPTIRKALRRLNLSLDKIDYFAVGLGPGSFTGLRIGLATVKGFAATLIIPVIGLPTLDLLARNALPATSQIICPLIDARRNLIFTAIYETGSNKSRTFSKIRDEYPKVRDKLKRISPYLLIDIGELLKRIPPKASVVFLGDAISGYKKQLKSRFKCAIILNEDAWYPRPRNLIKLAGEFIGKGKFSNPQRMKPIYLYPKECQIRNPNIKN